MRVIDSCFGLSSSGSSKCGATGGGDFGGGSGRGLARFGEDGRELGEK